MRIERIKQHNFRIYGGDNEVVFKRKKDKNISLIAGKNGFGKTTFLTSLIWGLYGNQMAQVEDKYKKDIKNSGGYESYLKTLLNKSILNDFDNGQVNEASFAVEVHLVDVLIPSIPCKKVVIKRSYDYASNKEQLQILIDGQENELTKEVGYDVFINDFILPREIAKFFFFDAEKIVTLAEAKTKSELRSLGKAYSEVLGIKKYEDLKLNLSTLLTKLKRSGVDKGEEAKVAELESKRDELEELLNHNEAKQVELTEEINKTKLRIDQLQEQLIREGNDMTLDQLNELNAERDSLRKDLEVAKGEVRKMMDLVPFIIAKNRFKKLIDQIKKEQKIKSGSIDKKSLSKELDAVKDEFTKGIADFTNDTKLIAQMTKYLNQLAKARVERVEEDVNKDGILLDFDDETARKIIATYDYVQNSFKGQFESTVKAEKDIRQAIGRLNKKIKEGEARTDNPLAQRLRKDKLELIDYLESLENKKESLVEEFGALKHQETSNNKVLSEKLKQANLLKTDSKKYEVTLELLDKLNTLTAKIKEEKKYSLQKSIQIGLRKLMHKDGFVANVKVRIEEDVMDIDLIDSNGNVIDKDSLSKGEQQLYATALLKALVDESGIDFPVFIDSPLQKFDKEHSSNVIEQFYPSISEQVVLFPLLEKELSKDEYQLLLPNLADVHLIQNTSEGSSIEECKINELFTKFNEQHVLAY